MRRSSNLLAWSLINLGIGVPLVYFEAVVILICSGESEVITRYTPQISAGVAIAIIACVELAYVISIIACLINGLFNQYARFRTPGTILSIVCIVRELFMLGSLITAVADYLA